MEEICNYFINNIKLVYSLEGVNKAQITELIEYVNIIYFSNE